MEWDIDARERNGGQSAGQLNFGGWNILASTSVAGHKVRKLFLGILILVGLEIVADALQEIKSAKVARANILLATDIVIDNLYEEASLLSQHHHKIRQG